MDYIEKMQELLSSGYSKTEVAENLYLNYHSIINTDEVYKIRKRIAHDYDCNINDVKLIGSAQHLQIAQHPQLHLQQMSMQTQAGNVHRHWIHRLVTMEEQFVWN